MGVSLWSIVWVIRAYCFFLPRPRLELTFPFSLPPSLPQRRNDESPTSNPSTHTCRTGYGQHGDYLFGWEDDSLQRAMDTCTDQGGQPESCRALTVQSDSAINACKLRPVVDEVVEGTALRELPGCNPIQNGPGSATMVNGAGCGGVPSATATNPGPTSTAAPTPTPTTTQTTVVVPTPSAPAGALIPKYGQCGGNGWTGGTQCVSGSVCTKLNDW